MSTSTEEASDTGLLVTLSSQTKPEDVHGRHAGCVAGQARGDCAGHGPPGLPEAGKGG